MTDRIETFGKSVIQHGKHSDRVYLMQLAAEDVPAIIAYLDELAGSSGYSKIFAKVPQASRAAFEGQGYHPEAVVPKLYRGETDVCFMGKYLCPRRQQERQPALVEQALAAALGKGTEPATPALGAGFRSRLTIPDDAVEMAELYRQVFATYPFPIHDPGYLQETMASHVIYQGVWAGRQLVALASAETDAHGQNAEMTDFATLPSCQGQGFASYLLDRLEGEAQRCGIRTAYTIARAYSFGMNITFAKRGYNFSGTLTHNTQISGELESMNVWHKPLAAGVAP